MMMMSGLWPLSVDTAPQLEQLRTQKKDVTGLFAEDVTGDLRSVRSAVGSAGKCGMDLLARRRLYEEAGRY